MDRIITGDVWQKAARLLKNGGQKTAAIAYVSKGSPLLFGKGDILICDASDQAIKSGVTDAKTLRGFLEKEATLYSCPNLHAKILISKDAVVIGSANLSASSAKYLLEASLITTRSQIRSQAVAIIHNIIKASTLIDKAFISRISSLPVTKKFRPFARYRKPKIEQTGDRYWVINTIPYENEPVGEEKYVAQGEEEARKVIKDPDAEINRIRWTGKARFGRLAKAGDIVLEISRYKSRGTVSNPRSILNRRHRKRWTWFYLVEPEMEISWTRFERELKKAGVKTIKKKSIRELNERDVVLVEAIWRAIK